MRLARTAALAAAFFSLVTTAVFAAPRPQAQWIGTWAAAPQGIRVRPFDRDPANATYRDIVHTSLAGTAYRIQLTNEFGKAPLKIGAVDAALSAGDGGIEAGSSHAVTFDGRSSVTIPTGAMVYSDPVEAALPAAANLAISVYLPEQRIDEMTCHHLAMSTNYVLAGNAVAAASAEGARKIEHWCFVKGVDVLPENPRNAGAVVTLGDSITDGYASTTNANHRWPDFLARRLQANPATANLGVLNEAIDGNCVLHRCAGESALRRFDRDVLAQSGVKYLIILEGINDIGATRMSYLGPYNVTAADLIFGLRQMVERAHEHGIKVFGGTITPYQGAEYYSAHGEQIREAVNHWIRTGGVFDGVVDFDKAVRDPADLGVFAPAAHSPDHLHPSDPGYKVMGDAVNLKFFR